MNQKLLFIFLSFLVAGMQLSAGNMNIQGEDRVPIDFIQVKMNKILGEIDVYEESLCASLGCCCCRFWKWLKRDPKRKHVSGRLKELSLLKRIIKSKKSRINKLKLLDKRIKNMHYLRNFSGKFGSNFHMNTLSILNECERHLSMQIIE